MKTNLIPPHTEMGETGPAFRRRRKQRQAPQDNRSAGFNTIPSCEGLRKGQCPYKQQTDGAGAIYVFRHSVFQRLLRFIKRRSDRNILFRLKLIFQQ